MNSAQPLVIVGAGGLGRETAALVEAINAAAPEERWMLKGFVDDDPDLHGVSLLGYPVLGEIDWLAQQANLSYVIAIGAPSVRRTIAHRLSSASPSPAAPVIHPSVSIHRTVHIGNGSIICDGVTPTVSIHVGAHVIINLHCTLGHDSVIGDHVTLHPGVRLSGASHIASGAELGTGSVILPGVRIGRQVTVGAGAVVTQDLPPHCTAVGVPARPLDA